MNLSNEGTVVCRREEAGLLLSTLTGWLWVKQKSEVEKTCEAIKKNYFLLSVPELMERIKKGLSENDIPFLKVLSSRYY